MRIWGTLFYVLFSLGLAALCLAFFLGGFLVVQKTGAHTLVALLAGFLAMVLGYGVSLWLHGWFYPKRDPKWLGTVFDAMIRPDWF